MRITKIKVEYQNDLQLQILERRLTETLAHCADCLTQKSILADLNHVQAERLRRAALKPAA